MKELSYLNKYLLKYKWTLLLGVVFVALANVLKVLSPRVISYAIDMVAGNLYFFQPFKNTFFETSIKAGFRQNLIIFSLVYLGLALIGGVFTFFMRQTVIVMSRKIEFDLKNEIYNHYQKLDVAFYKRNNTGDLMNRATEDVSRVRMYLGPALMYAINLVFLVTFVIYTMVSINPKLTLWVLLPLPLLSVSIYYVNGLINKKSEEIQAKLSDLTTDAQEYYSGVRVLKTYVQELFAFNNYEKQSETYKVKSLELARIQAFFFPLMLLLTGISTIIVIYFGGLEIMNGSATPGNIAEFVIYVNMLTWPVTSLGWVASIVQRASASQKRINQFLKTEPSIYNSQENKVKLNGAIEFKNVSFTYPDTGITALKNVSFKINAGERWAIIGRTGSGKSTIADLIFRLYDVDEGSIEIDGVNIKDWNLQALREQMGYVPQEVFLFSDTIMNNIRFADISTNENLVLAAAEKSAIKTEIEAFPDGFNAMVGERGVTLSGGQKQRISIARALVKNPKFIVFDDSLSAVDASTEERILGNIKTAIDNKTSIIITHRIFGLLDFDNILVLDEGRITEQGNHLQLMANQGLYFDIYNKQQVN